ncbi:ankyrin repeat-containing domain protein [Parachaetomium inaequale]|uniref:Ankyrin repeat-containing domain protein n=1 Tax=Parachaetomium inaequale TaxID=2588326 RepID=A0AAN6PAV1_9PEZI|nr:ankyrin repeat-containing domain protein [Parachaetomium inaequale]
MATTGPQGLEILVPANYLPNQGNVEIDIIAVPGLGADPSRSFGSETPRGFNWLTDEREGVRSDIPKSRVLLYHYDSRWLGAQAKEQTIYNVAILLLESIVEKRKGEDEVARPLVFLAHSMGGLVVAKALALAAQQRDKIEYMRIIECFAGCIFFGTPFSGSSSQAKAYLLATFLEKVNRAVPNQLLQLLDRDRDSLEELRRDFVNLSLREPRAKLVCFYELEATNYLQEKVSGWVPKNHFKLGPREIVVTKESATLNGAADRGMPCNHRQLNRFDSAKDGRYEIVRYHLKDIVKDAHKIVRARLKASRQSAIDDATFARLSQSLNLVEFQRQLRSVKALSGDSGWILKEQKYLDWSTQASHGIQPQEAPCLWVSGDEGLGKSKAAAAVIQELQKREAENDMAGARNAMVAYFFCDSTPDCSKAENVLKSLMWQLILGRRSLAQYVRSFAAQDLKLKGSGQGAEEQFSMSRLWKGLADMLRDPSVHDVYFVVNNLHYLPQERHSTHEFLRNVSEALTAGDMDDPIREKVRWMFLGRNREHLRDLLLADGAPTLWVNLNDSSMSAVLREQMRSFTRGRVKELASRKSYSLALQYFVFSSLEKRSESNNIWVEVVCRLLEGIPPDFNVVRRMLESLPQDPLVLIHRTWAQELKEDKEDIETVKEILRTLAITFEEPTTYELSVLAGLDLDPDDAEFSDKVLQKIRACGPLLRTYDTETWEESGYQFSTRVAFIHPIARDALLTHDMKKLIGLAGDGEAAETEVRWQHGIIGLRCFTYMLGRLGMPGDDDSSVTLQRTAPSTEEQADAEINDLFPEHEDGESTSGDDDEGLDVLAYPLKYWLQHGYRSTPDFVETLDMNHGFWSLDSVVRQKWWGEYAKREDYVDHTDMTALHIAAYFGLLPLANSLLKSGHAHEIHAHDSWANQPLHWAADRGHVEVCERLLQEGADMDDGIATGEWTPLHMAASSGQAEVIAHLLDGTRRRRPAQINAVAKEVGTPLTLAILGRQYKAAETLLAHGANVTLAAADSEPPVAAAALRGAEVLLGQLLEAGGGANLASHEYGSALAAAASAGNPNIVQTLLPLDRDPAPHQRALEEAASAGFHSVVVVILHGSGGLPCGKALELAAYSGHDNVVAELWRYHQYYNVIPPDAVNNALYKATDMQREATVAFLLQFCGADPDATGDEYGNALTASAFDGTMSILRMLLERGAKVDMPEGYPLQAAALNGHTEIVTLLLDHGAHPNAFSPHIREGTALQAACTTGNTEVARILLARGADPGYGDGDFTNPLTAATSNGYGDAVELLLQYRADPNAPGGLDGSTPLINAACTLPAKYLDLLIRHGAFVDQRDPDEDTALIMSALVGDDACVEALLNHGAHVNLGGKHHGSALHAAASNGHAETCRLLLRRGADARMRGGPYNTVLQAAAASGSSETVKAILAARGGGADVNAQGGDHFTALHAAAVQEDDGCLRQLLALGPKLDVFPKNTKLGTPLQAAAFAGCDRNARLLLEAGADPNVVAGKHGTALQAAALKGGSALCALLLARGARVDGSSGKYGHPLVAAVARFVDDDDDDERADVLELLLGQQEKIPAAAYKAALDRAFRQRDKAVFKQVLAAMKSVASKNVKLFPNIKGMLAQFKKTQRDRSSSSDANSDFGDDVPYVGQDIDDVEEEEEEEEEGQARQETSSRSLGSVAERPGEGQMSQRGGMGLPYRSPTGGGGVENSWQSGQSVTNAGFSSWAGNGYGGQVDSTESRDLAASGGEMTRGLDHVGDGNAGGSAATEGEYNTAAAAGARYGDQGRGFDGDEGDENAFETRGAADEHGEYGARGGDQDQGAGGEDYGEEATQPDLTQDQQDGDEGAVDEDGDGEDQDGVEYEEEGHEEEGQEEEGHEEEGHEEEGHEEEGYEEEE